MILRILPNTAQLTRNRGMGCAVGRGRARLREPGASPDPSVMAALEMMKLGAIAQRVS